MLSKRYEIARSPAWVIYVFGIFVFSIFVWLSHSIQSESEKNFRELTNVILENSKQDITREINNYHNMVKRMSNRFTVHRGLTNAEWAAEAEMHLKYYAGAKTLAWVDTSSAVQWAEPSVDKNILIQNFAANSQWRDTLLEVLKNKKEAAIVVGDNNPELMFLIPAYSDNMFIGVTVGLINLNELFNTNLHKGRAGLVLYYGDRELYSRGFIMEKEAAVWVRKSEFSIQGVTFKLKIWPSRNLVALHSSGGPVRILFLGFIFTLLAISLIKLLQRNILFSAELKKTNQMLKIEMMEKIRINGELKNLTQAADQSPSALIITDSEGIIEYVNPKLTQMTGYPAKEILGKKTGIFKSGNTPQEEYEKLWKTIKSGHEWTGEFYNRKKDGTFFWVSTAISGVRDSMGIINHFISSQEDITQRKQIQTEIMEHAKELEKSQREKDHVITELQQLKTELEEASRTDPLTHLLNRRGMIKAIEAEIFRYNRHKNPFSFIMADIDHFKIINDTSGHDAGDHVLTEVAQILKESLRHQDIVCRWGGEEFLIILPETDIKGGALLAEKIRTQIQRKVFYYESTKLYVTMSFGLSEFNFNTNDMDLCIKLADENMFEAKAAGRNQVIAKLPNS